jgi:16S rRNA (adenine1518-N6/adenine1519-N6)-dimethyltransferase
LQPVQYTLKKSLGQHFLKDENITRQIVAALQQEQYNNLVEVGAGGGALTKHLLPLPNIDFKAVELDDEKVQFLEATYPAIKGKIIHKDFLQMEAPFEEDFIVIGNFPYNISTQIVFKVLEWKEKVPVMIGMFQKEVAQRAAAAPGSKIYGVLSALIQPYYDIEYLFDVAPGCFDPPPKVNSGVIRLKRKKAILNVRSERSYIVLVKTAFNQRRKTLRNAVKSLFDPEELKEPIFDQRAERLSIEDFARLTFKMR